MEKKGEERRRRTRSDPNLTPWADPWSVVSEATPTSLWVELEALHHLFVLMRSSPDRLYKSEGWIL